MLISLTDVKINNDYTYIETVAPTVAELEPAYLNGETWLNTTDGLSYELTDQTVGTWTQIEKDKDAKINLVGDDTLLMTNKSICNIFSVGRNTPYSDLDLDDYRPDLDNWTNKDQFELQEKESVFTKWTFSASTKTITVVTDEEVYGTLDSFVAGDLIYLSGSLRNNGYYTVASVTSNQITVNEDLVNGEEYAIIYLSIIPQSYKNIVGRMINYDIYDRNETGKGMKSEKWGTYSYTREAFENGLKYPDEVIAGIDAYKIICIGGSSVFVD